MRIVNWRGCPRVPTGAHGCPRVSKKAYFFPFSPLENALLRVKNARKSWLSDLSVSTHGRFELVTTKILRNTSCTYEYIYVYVYIYIYIYVWIYVSMYVYMHTHT